MKCLRKADITNISANSGLLSCFNISSQDFLYQTFTINVNYDVSVIEHDDNGNIIGILIFGDFNILDGSPITNIDINKAFNLSKKRGINGYMFYINDEYRGTGLDRKMLKYAYDKIIRSGYDYIWVGVAKELRTHNYWLKKGFVKLFDFVDKATFYIYNLKN